MSNWRKRGRSYRAGAGGLYKLRESPPRRFPERVGPPPDRRVVREAFAYAPWQDALIHFGKNKGLRLGELRMAQAWWYLEKFDPVPIGHAAQPSDEAYALRFALNGMLRAIAESPEEAAGAELRRAKSGYPTARDILTARGLPVPQLKQPQQNNEHTS